MQGDNIDTNWLRHRNVLALLWGTAVGLIFLVWWQVSAQVAGSLERGRIATERDLANLTRVTQEHAGRTLQAADQVLRFVQTRYLDVGSKLDLADLAARGIIDTEIFAQVGVIDEMGIYILSNLPIKARLDLSDREHFRVHIPSTSTELFVSKPVLGRASGKWSIQLSRRLTRANGEFAGVAVVSIDTGYFTSFYGDLDLGHRGVHALYGLDGVARARKIGHLGETPNLPANPASATTPTTISQSSPMLTKIAAGVFFGGFDLRSEVDQVERRYYFRKLPRYPLVVVSGLDTQDFLASHISTRNALWFQGGIATVLVLALVLALSWHLNLLRREAAERQAARDLLHDQSEQLRAIFALSPDGFVSFDAARRVKYVSPAFEQLLAGRSEDLVGLGERQFSDWLCQRCLTSHADAGMASLREAVGSGKPDATVLVEVDANGKRTLQLGLRHSDGQSVSQILYFRDVTKETEVDHMKSEFLATAAHELRTPMASVLGFAEVLLGRELPDAERNEFLNIILTQSRAMADILDELLDLARIEARRGKDFRLTHVDLREFVPMVLKAVTPPVGRKPLSLSLPATRLSVLADMQKLRQALLNVISNAYKYSTVNGGEVELQVEVAMDASHRKRACIRVRDSGIGMTREQVSRVCERFYRADTSGKVPGTGLGMSIVKEIIELHRGEVEIESLPGIGTRVTLWLPMLDEASAS